MTPHFHSLGLAALAAITALAGPSFAAADDSKVYGAAFCRGNDPADFRHVGVGALRNVSAGTRRAFCPVVRDVVSAAMDIDDWDVVVDRNGATQAWDINLLSWNFEATTGFYSQITVPGSDGKQALDGGGITAGYQMGLVTIWTNMPAGADIWSYHVEETD